MKYLILCNRHESVYGDNWCLFWGFCENEGNYSSDLRLAHRFDESELGKFDDSDDIPIPVNILGISEEQPEYCTINRNTCLLLEKGKLNDLINLELKKKREE